MSLAIELAERRLVPDRMVRVGIRNLLRKRLAEEADRAERPEARDFASTLSTSAVALATAEANRQHYEVPVEFFREVLGPNLKYSAALFPDGVNDLGEAEERMLSITAERARLSDGQQVLELGCGWGSLTLWMARRFPNSRILAVSNSLSQRTWIESQAAASGLENVNVVTADVNTFDTNGRFDRVVSVEMFEHVRNWEGLLGRIRRWLNPAGLVFLHFFAHRRFAYPFEAVSADDWMGKHFFTGGMMPSEDLPSRLSIPFDIVERWRVGGEHYARTAEAWLGNLDRNRDRVKALFSRDLGEKRAARQVQRWRMFFLACSELFGFQGGSEWLVSHVLLAPRERGAGQ